MDSDRSMVVLGAVVGAALGSMAGYLFLTERGRRLRQEFALQAEGFVHELGRLQRTFAHARVEVERGLQADVARAGERQSSGKDHPAPF